jgi:hypothetical protein
MDRRTATTSGIVLMSVLVSRRQYRFGVLLAAALGSTPTLAQIEAPRELGESARPGSVAEACIEGVRARTESLKELIEQFRRHPVRGSAGTWRQIVEDAVNIKLKLLVGRAACAITLTLSDNGEVQLSGTADNPEQILHEAQARLRDFPALKVSADGLEKGCLPEIPKLPLSKPKPVPEPTRSVTGDKFEILVGANGKPRTVRWDEIDNSLRERLPKDEEGCAQAGPEIDRLFPNHDRFWILGSDDDIRVCQRRNKIWIAHDNRAHDPGLLVLRREGK